MGSRDLFPEHPIDFDGAARARMPGDERAETRHDEWCAGWEAHRVQELTLALGATPAQRLAWLEEAILLAHREDALPKRRE